MSAVTHDLAGLTALSGQEREWAYNALDCTGTRAVWDALIPRLDKSQARIYAFRRALQAPVMTMMRRGLLVDQKALKNAVHEIKTEQKRNVREIDRLPEMAIWDAVNTVTGECPKAPKGGGHHKWPRGVPDAERKCERCGAARQVRAPFNPNGWAQTDRLLHVLLALPREQNKKGVESTDDEVLERLERKHSKQARLIGMIRLGRDLSKQIGTLSSRQTADGRMQSSFNIAAAWTDRFSSSKNPFGLGTNLQNISERHRHVFISDPGFKLFYADLERAESLVVAYISGDEKYIEAHKGDTHTFVARLLWPESPWTGDDRRDRVIAEQNPEWDKAPGHNYRFQSKRIQHGSNYGLTPYGIARIAHIPQREAEIAQGRYFDSFPGISQWHKDTWQQVQDCLPMVNPLGYRVQLMGRPWDRHTWRQALSLVPQSTVAMVLNVGLWRLWRENDPDLVELLAQAHDAVLGQCRAGHEQAASRAIVKSLQMPVLVDSPTGLRTMTIPVEVMMGHNWGKFNDDPKKGRVNLDGLRVVQVR